MTQISLVLLGGAAGALARYAIGVLSLKLFGPRYPWGTATVNLMGCFFIGLSVSLAAEGHWAMGPRARLFFVTGFLGAFTTFSTFALDTAGLLQAEMTLAFLNILLNNVGGIMLVFLGLWMGRLF